MARQQPASPFWDEQVQSLVSSSLDAVIAIDQQGVVADWNPQAAATFGWQRHEVVGRLLSELVVPPQHRAAHVGGLARYRETGEAPVVGQRLELTAVRRDGDEFPIELSVTRVTRSGEPFFVAFVRDLTELHQRRRQQSHEMLEAKLLGESVVEVATAGSFEESLQSILDTLCEQIDWPLGHVWIPDDAGRLLVSSGSWHIAEGLGEVEGLVKLSSTLRFRSGQGLPGSIWEAAEPLWVEDISTAGFHRRDACHKAGIQTLFAFPVMSHHELQAILELFHVQKRPRDDELLAIVARLGQRIGELVRSRRYEQQQAKLAAIVDSSYDAIIGKDLAGVITSWNAGAERIYGYSEEEAVGSPITILLPDGMKQEEEEIRDAIRHSRRLEQFQTTRQRRDGTRIPVSLTVSPIIDSAGNLVGASSIERDISQRRRRERELHDAREAASRANRARGEFLANVSHELRTPMNAIIGMTQIALDEELSDEVRDYVKTANEAAHSLLTILNEILDFSKLESGKFSISNEPFTLSTIIDETLRTISAQAFAKGLELVCELPEQLPETVIGDPMRLRQVLTNLLSNAIKFTEAGEVVLRVRVVRQWPGEIRLRFQVVDTGVGISAEDQRRILEPFVQVDSSPTREHGGTGLGLAICSELLRMMGGRLSLDSELGRGSTFSFNLSFELTADDRAPSGGTDALQNETLKALRVLVVDDNATNRRILSDVLNRWSMRPTLARDADQALALYRAASQQGKPFTLVIVDALMPGTDGYDLSRKLAELAPDAESPVILMVSSTDRREFRDREDQAGISVFLQKPVTQSDLMNAVVEALQLEQPKEVLRAIEPQQGEPLAPLSVLLAEDTPANQKFVTTLLRKRGHAVTVARNGREVVDLYKQERFDVVLMDVQMPIMDGFQATSAIRDYERDAGKATPIIAMTAHAMRGDREKCLEAGMDAYIAKPLDTRQLLGLIESIAEEGSEKMEDRPAPVGPSDGSGAEPKPVLDYPAAMRRLADDADLYREFIGFYDESAEELSERLRAAVDDGEAEKVEGVAHQLKGLVSNLGAVAMEHAAADLELAGRTKKLADAPQMLAKLLHERERLERALGPYRS